MTSNSGSATTTMAVVGAGNVATHLAAAFYRAGVKIVSVTDNSGRHAPALAAALGAEYVARVEDVSDDVDFTLIATTDAAVDDISRRLSPRRSLVAHTSGSVPLDTLSQRHPHAAVLYPLQTFSRDVAVDLGVVPFFTEATSSDDLAAVDAWAHRLGDNVYHADSSHRRYLHIAGVLTSNFPIYLLEGARQVLARGGYPLEVVRPLVEASMNKAFATSPTKALTGPARRGDVAVTELQEATLESPFKEIYHTITQAILNDYHGQN